jgi:hypothetical protein
VAGAGPDVAARPLVAGEASGRLLVLDEPLSFWGGLDPETGRIVDRLHPQAGESATGAMVCMPAGRGSSSSSTIVAETVRLGTAPAAIILREPDHVLVVGSLVAQELYGSAVPLCVLEEPAYSSLGSATKLTLASDGTLTLAAQSA